MIHEEIVDQVTTLSTAALSLVAALAWNDAVRAVMSRYYPQQGEGIGSKVAYATIITGIAVVATVGIIAGAHKAKTILVRGEEDA